MTHRTSIVVVGTAALLACEASGQYLPVTPYLSSANSPFSGLASTYFHIENFESGRVAAPGLTAVGGIVGLPGNFTDSVDGDDGVIDGSGVAGISYFPTPGGSVLTFNFNGALLGNFPTHAGVVWTDVGNVTSGTLGFGDVTFSAFDSGGMMIGVGTGATMLGDGAATGGTAEDRFFGVVHPGGISRIVISMSNSTDWEVDHVQYAFVPAPSAAAVLALGLGGLIRRRRQCR